MDFDDSDLSIRPPLRNHEMEEKLEAQKLKVSQLQETLNALEVENLMYKKKSNDLRRRLRHLNKYLEDNTQLFHQLLDDYRNAIQMGRLPLLNTSHTLPTKGDPATSLSPTRHQQLRTPILRRRCCTDFPRKEDQLEPTIIAASGPTGAIKEVPYVLNTGNSTQTAYVCLERLPSDVVSKHLSMNGFSQISTGESPVLHLDSYTTSTPLKLQTMLQLGLMPVSSFYHNRTLSTSLRAPLTPSPSQPTPDGVIPSTSSDFPKFITVRKRSQRETSSSPRRSPITVRKRSHRETGSSPRRFPIKREKVSELTSLKGGSAQSSIKTEPLTPPTKGEATNQKKKKIKIEARVEMSTRPARKARPLKLVEESLKKKKRRS